MPELGRPADVVGAEFGDESLGLRRTIFWALPVQRFWSGSMPRR